MRRFIFLFVLFYNSSLVAQVGGDNVYGFLNINSSARVASLGGNQIAVKDNDPFLGGVNPALLNSEMSDKLSLSYIDYLADVSFGFASFTKHFDSVGTFNLGIQYVDYGDFIETDFGGNEIGTFTAGEYAFILGYGRQLDSNFSAGVNLKPIFSNFYDYNSVGIAADLGLTYYSERRLLTMSLLAKNFGRQLTTYRDDNQEDLPFEIQMGISKRLSKVPLRLSLIAQNLQQGKLTYENPAQEVETESILDDDSENDREKNEDGFLENVARHLIFNAEFLVTDNFNVRFGYNYLRRTELRIDEKLGTVGISWGFGMRISKFHLSYARAAYHQAGSTNTFSISTRLTDFIN